VHSAPPLVGLLKYALLTQTTPVLNPATAHVTCVMRKIEEINNKLMMLSNSLDGVIERIDELEARLAERKGTTGVEYLRRKIAESADRSIKRRATNNHEMPTL
jgi:hypothetical protein